MPHACYMGDGPFCSLRQSRALPWRGALSEAAGPERYLMVFGSVAILLDSEMAMSSAHGDFNLCEAALSNTRSCRRSRKHNSCNDGISQEL